MNLTKERLDRGFTIAGLAKELGVSEQTISRLESGQAVRPANAKVIADFFGVRVTDLMPVDHVAPNSGAA